MEDTKKTQQPKRLAEMQEEVIFILNKLVASMEMNTSLLQENTQLREKVIKLEMQVEDAIQVPPIHNGIIKIMEESRK